MAIDDTVRRRGEFPTDQPLNALRADHDLVRHLFERYFQAEDENGKRDAGRHILLMLDTHASVEEGVFYPRVREADPALVDHCEEEHEQARQLIEHLKVMDEGDPQAQQLFRELADVVLAHIEAEEQQLFPKVEQANLDLGAIGEEMLALETRMIGDRSQRPTAPGLRQ